MFSFRNSFVESFAGWPVHTFICASIIRSEEEEEDDDEAYLVHGFNLPIAFQFMRAH